MDCGADLLHVALNAPVPPSDLVGLKSDVGRARKIPHPSCMAATENLEIVSFVNSSVAKCRIVSSIE